MARKISFSIIALLSVMLLASTVMAGAKTEEFKEYTLNFKTPADYYLAEDTEVREFDSTCMKKFVIKEINDAFYGTFPDDCVSDCSELVLIIYIEDDDSTYYSEPISMESYKGLGKCVSVDSISSEFVAKLDKKGIRVGGAAVFMEYAIAKDNITYILAQSFRDGALGRIYAEIEVDDSAAGDGKVGCAATCKTQGGVSGEDGCMVLLTKIKSRMAAMQDQLNGNTNAISDLKQEVHKIKRGLNRRVQNRRGRMAVSSGVDFEFFACDSIGGIYVVNDSSKVEGGINIIVDGESNTAVRVINKNDSEIDDGINIKIDR